MGLHHRARILAYDGHVSGTTHFDDMRIDFAVKVYRLLFSQGKTFTNTLS